MSTNFVSPDAHDEALADRMYSAVVIFEYMGAAHYCGRKQMTGFVTDVRTMKNGERELLIVADGINLPRWIHERDIISYVWVNEKTTTEVAA